MKKFLAIVLALVMALSLVACGNDGNSDDTPGTDTIKIGWYGPMSGSAASVGLSGETAVKLAVKLQNEKGGLLGKQIELVEYDDEGKYENSVKCATRLVEQDGVCAVIGSHLSSSVLATSDVTEAAKIIQIGTGTSNIWTNIGLKYTFRPTVCSSLFNKDCYASMVTMGATKIATLSAETEYAQGATEAVEALINADPNMEVVAHEGYTSGDTDFSGQITKMMAANPDGVLLNGGGEDLGKIVKALRMQGYEGYIYGIESLADQQTLELAGEYADGVVFSCCYFVPQNIEDAANDFEKDFLTKYMAEYNELPVSEVAYRAWDGAHILFKAIEAAGSTDGDAVRAAILSTPFEGIASKFDFSDESGDGIVSGTTFYIDGGKIVTLEKFLNK